MVAEFCAAGLAVEQAFELLFAVANDKGNAAVINDGGALLVGGLVVRALRINIKLSVDGG